ncbi:MAG TPA: dihydroorotate dehydrogenase-like protein [Acidimicrobiia bacterium]|nr:dihydroorotate dehydrogenase-like protein [Acidimicrobiia bacterium]
MIVDLTTTYLGLTLAHPVMPSASPLTGDLDHLHQLVEAGASAVVLPSLFEEQIEHEAMALHHGLEWVAGTGEATSGFLPEMDTYNTGPRDYLDLVRGARRELGIPVIASLNGTSTGGWTLYAKILADEGIDALELNVYFVAADFSLSSSEVEYQYLRLVSSVRQAVQVPLAVKVGPYFSSMASMGRRLVDAGADGLVLFNRFYQPDIDLDQMEVAPNLVLSTPAEARLALRWIAILRGRIDCSLAATTGIHGAEEAIKMILAGADVTMMASALLRHGPERLTATINGLREWLQEHQYLSVEQAKGSLSQQSVSDPVAFERSNYMKTLISYTAEW